jgi:NADH-quinone oxidoreductase subunit J
MSHFLISLSTLICVISAVAVISMRNPVHSVLFLVLSFCSGAILLLATGAEFLGLMVLVVYVGAIAILFLFVVIMLNINIESKNKERRSLVFVGTTFVLFIFGCLQSLLEPVEPIFYNVCSSSGLSEWFVLFDCLNTLETLGQII